MIKISARRGLAHPAQHQRVAPPADVHPDILLIGLYQQRQFAANRRSGEDSYQALRNPPQANSGSVSPPRRPSGCGAPNDRADRAVPLNLGRMVSRSRWVLLGPASRGQGRVLSTDRHLIRAQPVGGKTAQVALVGQHPPGLAPASDAE